MLSRALWQQAQDLNWSESAQRLDLCPTLGAFTLLHARFLVLGQQYPYGVGRNDSFFARKSIRSLVILFDKDGAESVFRANAPNARKSFPASFRAHRSEQAFL